ncbi:MAG: ABC transporter substrate-binding protein [Kastovskya adunca ATA6-11-RM4]|nr:ABC transporter substrate-binding protein [Kastovskya adunca ATA6-11-RM4]
MWRRLGHCFLVGWMLLVLTGCQLLPVSAAESGVTKITLWHGVNPPSNRDVLQTLVDQFNQEHSDIQVESLYVGQEDQQTPKILAAIVGNSPPDLLWYNPTITGRLVEMAAIRPLDDLLAASPVGDELDPSLWESMQFQGRIWSVPFGTNNAGIFYRPSLFKAAGITQMPQTWEELRQVAHQLTRDTDGDGRSDRYGILLPLGKGDWTVFMWLPFLWSAGGELTDKANTTNPENLQLVTSEAIAALQFWRDLLDDGSAVLSLPERGYEMDGFVAGKVAMEFSGPWTLAALQATGADFAVLPIPRQERHATVIGGENLFVFKTTPEREQAAFTFAEYAMSEAFQTQWAMGTGYLPVNLKARESEVYQQFAEGQPAVKVFLEQAKYGRSRPLFRGYRRISENLGRAIEAVLLGKRSPKQALQDAQRRLDLIFR